MEPYTGEIRIFPGNFAPLGWMFCQGQLLSIGEYDTLYTLLGTRYGGDGLTTFALPDLRSRVVVGQGPLPGGSDYQMGQSMGTESVSLTSNQVPAHGHPFTGTIGVVEATGTPQVKPTGNYFGGSGAAAYATALGTTPGMLPAGAVEGVSSPSPGGSQPHANVQPVLATNYIISLQGTYPSRQD